MNFFALTIGPIYGTFLQARKTRTVWASSYFFSWFTKQILLKTKKEGFDILLPYYDHSKKSEFGAGMYADRIYFVGNEKGTTDGLRSIIKTIIEEISEDICKRTVHKDYLMVVGFLESYLNMHIVELSSGLGFTELDNSILNQLNVLLDNKELQTNFSFEINENPLLDYLETEISTQTILTKDAFSDLSHKRFRSIPEIATTSLERTDQNNEYGKLLIKSYKRLKGGEKEEYEFLELLKESDSFKTAPYHKYFGVLYADGDNISELLKKVSGSKADLLKFSELLMDFALDAEKAIVNYGGNGIYLGGEDILAFIPMACVNKHNNELQTVFSLIEKLDQLFHKTLGKYAEEKGVTIPTLSYGLMLSYIKHPLKESMSIAHKLLENAKCKEKHPNKNTIGLRFQKHSGQVMECYIEKTTDKVGAWNEIKAHTENYTKNALKEKQKDILSGIMHRFNDELFYTTFVSAAKENRLKPLFVNFFDEEIHKKTEKNAFLEGVRNLAEIILREYGYENPNSRAVLFTILRLVHFINSEKE